MDVSCFLKVKKNLTQITRKIILKQLKARLSIKNA